MSIIGGRGKVYNYVFTYLKKIQTQKKFVEQNTNIIINPATFPPLYDKCSKSRFSHCLNCV